MILTKRFTGFLFSSSNSQSRRPAASCDRLSSSMAVRIDERWRRAMGLGFFCFNAAAGVVQFLGRGFGDFRRILGADACSYHRREEYRSVRGE